jgi:hypothetical protein
MVTTHNTEVCIYVYMSSQRHVAPEWQGPHGLCAHVYVLNLYVKVLKDNIKKTANRYAKSFHQRSKTQSSQQKSPL